MRIIYPHEVPGSVPLPYSINDLNEQLRRHNVKQYYIKQDRKTPEPTTTPRYLLRAPPGTRRDNILAVSFKAPDFTIKANRKMENKWCERTFVAMAGLVPGSNPTKAQLKKLSNAFDIEWDGLKEKHMYPILVRNRVHLGHCRCQWRVSRV